MNGLRSKPFTNDGLTRHECPHFQQDIFPFSKIIFIIHKLVFIIRKIIFAFRKVFFTIC